MSETEHVCRTLIENLNIRNYLGDMMITLKRILEQQFILEELFFLYDRGIRIVPP
jgi:hypothetical protein